MIFQILFILHFILYYLPIKISIYADKNKKNDLKNTFLLEEEEK